MNLLHKISRFFFPLDELTLPAQPVFSNEHPMPVENKKPSISFNFDKGREKLFTKGYTQRQVDSINAIVSECNKQGLLMPEQVAYILATAWHESRLEPISEWGSDKYLSKYDTGKLAKELGNTPESDGDGQFLKGRGFVMITGYRNYKHYEDLLKVPITKYPDLVLEITMSAFIIVHGMIHGVFTGKKLTEYINAKRVDYVNSRRTVNGVDKASLIAGYAGDFYRCIENS